MLLLLLCQKILDKQTSSHGETVLLVHSHIHYLESGIKILRGQQEELPIGCAFRLLCARFAKERICEGAELQRRIAKEQQMSFHPNPMPHLTATELQRQLN